MVAGWSSDCLAIGPSRPSSSGSCWPSPDLDWSTQILLWTGLSAALVAIWFRYLRPRTMSAVGTSAAALAGEVGLLVSDISQDSRGQVRFQKPILGADVWECYSETRIKAGERVRIVAVEGSYIRVEPAK
jgi:membrane protein implicated in regulation of membrane protease activity